MLRSAATVLLVSAPFVAAVPAQAAEQQDFPCTVDINKVDDELTSKVTFTLACDETRTVTAKIAVGGAVVNQRQTVQAGVAQSFTVTVNKVARLCAELETDGATTTACSA
ncbi:hypothetical protein [Streptomyces canus]|nr:hypothetical protein [Streptomyces canus]